MLYDAHTHLNGEELYPQREQHLAQFIEAGGVGLINSGASNDYNLKGIEIAQSALSVKRGTGDVCFVKATIGYHPDVCLHGEISEENIQKKIAELKSTYESNKDVVVAVGECGIDTYYPGTEETLPLQKTLFTLQCDLAKELGLPLMIHIRKDFEAGLEILKNYRDMTIHFHCRSFGPKEVERLRVEGGELNRKLFIGFCGNITYKNAQNLRDALAKVPLDQLLLETDAPWLSPQAVRGTTNTPANVKYIYEFVAQELNIQINELEQAIDQNIKTLYKIT
ncbi:MAG: TatD family hydrolase [candidate division SR1 bacterium]|nr:TatD family hydrolase [candidate division SR1 bacterium]